MFNFDSPYLPHPKDFTPRDLSSVKLFIVHHSDSADDTSPLQINDEHIARGFNGIGYDWLVYRTGRIIRCRPMNVIPAAAEDANFDSVDVCCVGQFDSTLPNFTPVTDAMQGALCDLRVYCQSICPSICMTIGHRDVENMRLSKSSFVEDDGTGSVATDCPGDALMLILPIIKQNAQAYLANPSSFDKLLKG